MWAKTLFLLLAFASLTGCRYQASCSHWESTLQHSTLFQEVQRQASHPGWMIDSENQQEIIVDIGDNRPERFEKYFTVKVVKASGKMFQLKQGDSGNDFWIPLVSMADPAKH
jgi:hypothetical protein